MSTESGKTLCEACSRFNGRTAILCPLHDGSLAKKLAEALREMITHHDRGYGPLTYGMRNRFDTMLAAYDELQGRKG